MAGKPKVTNEIWDDQRVKDFLEYQPYNQKTSTDFQLLYRAYKYMRPGDFGRFLVFFTDAGYDLEARDSHDNTLAETIADHYFGPRFIEEINKAKQAFRKAGSGS